VGKNGDGKTDPSNALMTNTSQTCCSRNVRVNANIPTHDSTYISTVVNLYAVSLTIITENQSIVQFPL